MAGGAWRCIAAAMLGCAVSTHPTPVSALGMTGGSTSVCTGSATLTFTSALLTVVPSAGPDPVTLSTPTPLTCTGLTDQTATLSFTGDALPGVACMGPLAVITSGSITFSQAPPVSDVTWIGYGMPYTEAWLFESTSGPLFATGTAVSLAPTDAISCVTSGTSTLTLTATIAVVA